MWKRSSIRMLSTKSGKSNLLVLFDLPSIFFLMSRENHLQVSMLVIDKKTHSKRKKKYTKISSSDPNVVLLYSEKMNPFNEAEILEAKNNLRNISESNTPANEPAAAVPENVDKVDAANDVNNLKNISASIDVKDKETIQENVEDNVENTEDFDFPDNNSLLNETVEAVMENRKEEAILSALENDNNSLLNETVEAVMEKRKEEAIRSAVENDNQEEDEVDSVEVVADEAEEEILDEELMECSDTDTSFKTASSTASIGSNEKVLYFIFIYLLTSYDKDKLLLSWFDQSRLIVDTETTT